MLDLRRQEDAMSDYQHVLRFWFGELSPQDWWVKNQDLDALIKRRFQTLHSQASAGLCYEWRLEPEGRLAEVIVLDQFSRNIYRDQAQAFAQDAQALVLAQEAIRVKADHRLSVVQRAFLYMPFMHSEQLAMHELAVKLYAQPGMASNLEFEFRHKAIIERFGRYPHRNAILGRPSSTKELAFLQTPGSSF